MRHIYTLTESCMPQYQVFGNHPWNIELLTLAPQKCVAFSSIRLPQTEPGGSCVIVGGWEREGGEGGEGERVQDPESSGLQSPTHCQEERGSCLTTSISSWSVNSSGWSWRTDSEGEGTLMVHKWSWTVHLYPLGLLPVRICLWRHCINYFIVLCRIEDGVVHTNLRA